ncbi:MAG: hypothetical protein ACR2OD_01090 [Gaiellaceae bacterium]
MLLPRLGALIVLGGFAYGLAIYGRMAWVTGVEGFFSWAWMILFLAPSTVLGVAAAILVLRRHPLGKLLTTPFVIVTVLTGLLAVGNAPPVGSFLDDYEAASLIRGLDVPPFEASQGLTTIEYAEKLAGDFRLQGALIAMGAAIAFYVMVRRGAIFTRRSRSSAPQGAGAVRPQR